METTKQLYIGNTTLAYVPAGTDVVVRNGSLTVEGNVGQNVTITHTGKGGVHIGGHVGPETTITSSGNVVVEKTTGRGHGKNSGRDPRHGTTIKAKGDITVNAGVNNYATLEADGSISAVSIASDSKVTAGKDVRISYQVYSRSKVVAGGKFEAQTVGENVSVEALGGSIKLAKELEHHSSLKAKGDVTVSGRVQGDTEIEAGGDVKLESTLAFGPSLDHSQNIVREGAKVKAGGNISVGAGVGNHSTLIAGGHIDAVSISSDSTLKAGGNITIAQSMIAAGRRRAAKCVPAKLARM